jgi:hypothetical protein
MACPAETSLQGASHDPAFLHAFWLLTQIPLAARGPAFALSAEADFIRRVRHQHVADLVVGHRQVGLPAGVAWVGLRQTVGNGMPG